MGVQIEKVVPEAKRVIDEKIHFEDVWATRRVEIVKEVPQPAPRIEKRQKAIVVEKRVFKPEKIVTPKKVWKDVVKQREKVVLKEEIVRKTRMVLKDKVIMQEKVVPKKETFRN